MDYEHFPLGVPENSPCDLRFQLTEVFSVFLGEKIITVRRLEGKRHNYSSILYNKNVTVPIILSQLLLTYENHVCGISPGKHVLVNSCGKGFDNCLIVNCIYCRKFFHAIENCADLTASEIKVVALKTNVSMVYECMQCKNNGLTCCAETMGVSKNNLDMIKDSVAKIDTSTVNLDSTRREVSELKKSIDDQIPSIQGAAAANTIGPIIVTLNSPEDAHLILKNRKRIDPRYIVALDKTKMQQAEYKKTKSELVQRISDGEVDLMIRFVTNIPTVVKKPTTSSVQCNDMPGQSNQPKE
ncbi:hypothetical protein QAD02_017320 [Eretmocerus hayati]|uniref:Uncharacterized protein n=1 Tax=Eretmocerus hayati TaxID=131215 RepID=A0ACC2PEP0_9HYME|nr:hypothetical protein QAD02_017320 [Eretmocerus hayati]